MSLAGPAPVETLPPKYRKHDGFYQAVFSSTDADLDAIRIETIARARRAGYEVVGDISLVHHRLGYNGFAELSSEVIIATAQVVPLAQLDERVPA